MSHAARRVCWSLSITFMIGCGARATVAGDDRASQSESRSPQQDVRSGIVVLCGSRWNGQLYGNQSVRWLPDELKHEISNDEVLKLAEALSSPVRDRVGMFDAFLSESRVVIPSCPFRERLSTWPSELPVIPAEENQPTPSL